MNQSMDCLARCSAALKDWRRKAPFVPWALATEDSTSILSNGYKAAPFFAYRALLIVGPGRLASLA